MEMLLYLLGNWCCIGAGLLLGYHTFLRPKKDGTTMTISRDLQILLLIGSLARCYWSCSPDPVWSSEPLLIKWISIADVFCSPILWVAVVYLIGSKQDDPIEKPVYLQWQALVAIGAVVSVVGHVFLPKLAVDDDSWPLTDVSVIFNMTIDGFAMIPQLYLITNMQDNPSQEASHFVGLLTLGRVLRMMFWAILIVPALLAGHFHAHNLWTFIIPDAIHTVLMGDYLYLWLKKVKRDKLDPFVNGMSSMV